MSELRGPLQHCARPCFGCAPVMRDGWKTIYTAYNSHMICTAGPDLDTKRWRTRGAVRVLS